MDINKHITFTLDVIKGKEKEYKAICVNVFGVKRVIAWLTDTQYEEIKSKLS